MTATAILAVVAGLLFLIALIPAASQYPINSVAGLLLSIAVFLSVRS